MTVRSAVAMARRLDGHVGLPGLRLTAVGAADGGRHLRLEGEAAAAGVERAILRATGAAAPIVCVPGGAEPDRLLCEAERCEVGARDGELHCLWPERTRG